MKLEEHKLIGENVEFKQTSNYSQPGRFVPDSIVIHYTAMFSAKSAVKVLTTKKEKGNASAHLVIGRDGKIWQLAPFNYKTWHAGKSFYNGRESYNNFSIGIELDNLGWLDKFEDGVYSRKGLKVNLGLEDVFVGKHRNPNIRKVYWHKYTKEQIGSLNKVVELITKNYDIKEILGHDEIAPSRKQDPGPAFDIEALREKFL